MYLPKHSYEEIREIVIDIMLDPASSEVNQFQALLEHVGRRVAHKHNAPALQGGFSYAGAGSRLDSNDADLVLEIVWDLFRQGIITLGLNSSNPGWPFLRLSRFGRETVQAQSPFRFHDASGFLKVLRAEVPDISSEALAYLEEAVAAFYSDCLLASCVMLGVASEFEFLRLIDVATSSSIHGARFAPLNKLHFIRQKITKFRDQLHPVLNTLPNSATEDLDTNLDAIQSVIRIARNDAGHPSGARPPLREQVYVYLQLFIPFAKQLMRLRQALA